MVSEPGWTGGKGNKRQQIPPTAKTIRDLLVIINTSGPEGGGLSIYRRVASMKLKLPEEEDQDAGGT